MKKSLLLVMSVVLVGCGEVAQPTGLDDPETLGYPYSATQRILPEDPKQR